MKNKTVYLILNGGLGNQLFKYLFCQTLNLNGYNCIFILESKATNYLSHMFDNIRIIDSTNFKYHFLYILYKLFKIVSYKEKNIFYTDMVEINKKKWFKIFVDGYFQSFKYFDKLDINSFQKLPFYNFDSLKRKKEKIAVHVRRGDYLLNGNDKIYHLIPFEYYKTAINYIRTKTKKKISCVIYSDDINIAYELRDYLADYSININEDANAIECFRSMIDSKHFVLANSTFSFWAAYLGRGKDTIVVAPNNFFINEKLDNDVKDHLYFDGVVIL